MTFILPLLALVPFFCLILLLFWVISYSFGHVPPLGCRLSEYKEGALVIPRDTDPGSPICDESRYRGGDFIRMREGNYVRMPGVTDCEIVRFAAQYWVAGGVEDVAARKHPEEAKRILDKRNQEYRKYNPLTPPPSH